MLHALAASGSRFQREIWWCYGARNGREHPFAAEVRELLGRLPWSHSFVAYSEPEDADQPGKDYDVSGHLDLSSIAAARHSENGGLLFMWARRFPFGPD